ncbi:MAG: LSM domain-containing protein, partial [Candidatus Aenigmatarchaeota archaeon]
MSSNQRPLDTLKQAIDSTVLVGLKGNRELRGKLAAYDTHVNLVLEEAEEIEDEEVRKRFGKM